MARRKKRRYSKSRSGGLASIPKRVFGMLTSLPGLIVLALGAIGIFVIGGGVKAKAESLASKVTGSSTKTATE